MRRTTKTAFPVRLSTLLSLLLVPSDDWGCPSAVDAVVAGTGGNETMTFVSHLGCDPMTDYICINAEAWAKGVEHGYIDIDYNDTSSSSGNDHGKNGPPHWVEQITKHAEDEEEAEKASTAENQQNQLKRDVGVELLHNPVSVLGIGLEVEDVDQVDYLTGTFKVSFRQVYASILLCYNI